VNEKYKWLGMGVLGFSEKIWPGIAVADWLDFESANFCLFCSGLEEDLFDFWTVVLSCGHQRRLPFFAWDVWIGAVREQVFQCFW
jgi:hypothetical protein